MGRAAGDRGPLFLPRPRRRRLGACERRELSVQKGGPDFHPAAVNRAEPSLYFRGRRLRLGNMVDPIYTLGASVLKSYLG
jgi:hypothetical protein